MSRPEGADGEQLHAFRELLALGVPRPRTIALLGDEEVLALADADLDPLAALPWLDTMTEVRPEDAAAFGRRSLLLRGVIRVDGGRDGVPDVEPHLRTALALLRIGRGWLRLSCTAGDAALLFCSVQPETGVVEEDVTRSGVHSYTVCTYADARDRALRWAWADQDGRPLPPGAGRDLVPRERRVAADEWPELVEVLLGDVRLVDVEGLGYGDDGQERSVQHQLAVSPLGALLATRHDGPEAEQSVRARVVGPEDLDELFAQVLQLT